MELHPKTLKFGNNSNKGIIGIERFNARRNSPFTKRCKLDSMYYWNERYENIWDSAPRPCKGGPKAGPRGIQCACQDKDLQGQLDKLLGAFCRITPQTVSDVAVRYLKEDLCCCNKNYCKHTEPNVSESELDSDVWELYTYFLNEFNAKSEHLPNQPKDTATKTDDSTEPEPTTKGDTDLIELFANDEASSSNNLPHNDPYFKVKVMTTMKECMKYRDIHRFYLLQHIKILLHYFNFVKDVEKETALPPGD